MAFNVKRLSSVCSYFARRKECCSAAKNRSLNFLQCANSSSDLVVDRVVDVVQVEKVFLVHTFKCQVGKQGQACFESLFDQISLGKPNHRRDDAEKVPKKRAKSSSVIDFTTAASIKNFRCPRDFPYPIRNSL